MVVEVKEKPKFADRIRRIREAIVTATVRVDTERFKFLLESYKETEGEPAVMRRAKLFDKILTHKTIYIDDNPIVGSVCREKGMVYPYPEWSCNWMRDEASHFTHLGAARLSEENVSLINEAVNSWANKCVLARTAKIFTRMHPLSEPGSYNTLSKCGAWGMIANNPLGFTSLDYGKVLNKGLNGVIAEVEDKLREVNVGNCQELPKYHFYSAVITSLKAVIKLAHRYAQLAEDMAQQETDPQRREELEAISRTMERIPANPAQSFYEAIQSYWFTAMAANIETETWGIVPGRFSQYIYPFYERDMHDGKITQEDAIELLEFLFLRHLEIAVHSVTGVFKANSGQTAQHFSLGGLTPDGKDATNEIDYLLLEAQKRLRVPQPSLTVLYHNGLPYEFLLKCVEVIKTGVGQPQFLGNDVMIKRLLYHHPGLTIEEARSANNTGCIPTHVSHATTPHYDGPFSSVKLLELALYNGKDPLTGRQIGLKVGEAESFASYGEFFEAVKKQLHYILPRVRQADQISLSLMAEFLPLSFQSALIDDCIKRGLGAQEGGAKYTAEGHQIIGTIDLANSLAAIKKLVYEEKQISMKELKEALRANFDGYEEILKMCLEAPKYGNDDDYVDSIATECYDLIWEEHRKIPSVVGIPGDRAEPFSVSEHFLLGEMTGALPSGRKARLALTDATVSATPGTDRNGPTALVNSAVKVIDTTKSGSNHLNMKFHPSALEGKRGANNLLALIKTYMDLGGSHIQFNCVSADVLKDAQLHPENYKDLVVRVAGFSAFFIHLDKGVQDEIIKRTELKFQ